VSEVARAAFCRRVVELPPGAVLVYRPADWRDAIVFVTAGAVELEARGGERRRFRRGDVLCLQALHLRLLSNPGRRPARLVAVRRSTGENRER
jgi:quercetin dioxygenase-like cupin family protein